MKWPQSLTFIRHGESAYNILKKNKNEDSLYLEFKAVFDEEYDNFDIAKWPSEKLASLARSIFNKFKVNVSDYATPLTKDGVRQANETAKKLSSVIARPDIVYVSPFIRTRQTLDALTSGCQLLKDVRVVVEERIREQEHGLSTVYNDWRVYIVLQPEQAALFRMEGDYEYKFLNGENKSDVRDRARSFVETLIREHAGENVLVVSHHLTLLSLRANLERWDREKFIEVDENDKPINCGVTIYKGHPELGKNGKLMMDQYNIKLY
ncbi:MAG: hypothetical protein UW46_C0001G0005 [Candidatus Yanofskybacteria bacterium GW2011_GWF1_44_227]|uniref:Phosphoglycerate mutase n=1 Tax=Candidatus Yanofskybacteria bacterium GW2011_GWE2_40_11 TaxID=1619033 RepID=A0A0G0QK57_9BACT|nr:MAG: hypothetical protein UT69_C0011G0009 [Candidatus Yanofskybacteria bacterium GW2011_GWE1_40_10]KKR40759.1 MAG: hypothetical protein UT75_C0005G0067 [Candidatus Yanofskybacteria bacterium GW2011_GWE2_40_11]KKT15971.1 MAG: hypothetical protein UV97_C0001G0144 [Candidatus Yanofskybacteria bacterium GW2011_GWF2_43_596]KKT53515.1 MAG: hypothetical protein UW46_C0001G0005 [Candidatus Yanofskybacteria bacterium GW2011_GWF1_44_227]OGN36040.1 MAG: hypothetical protein A2207_03210 [Candidatus Yano